MLQNPLNVADVFPELPRIFACIIEPSIKSCAWFLRELECVI